MSAFQLFGLVFFSLVTYAFVGDDFYNIVSSNSIVSSENAEVQTFSGNNSITTDYFRALERDGNSILIGGRNAIYSLSIKDMQENIDQRIIWHPTERGVRDCFMKGKYEEDCQNYIRVIKRVDGDQFLVCGTNAYSPLCRRYVRLADGASFNFTETKSGVGQCPFDPRQNSTHVYVGGELYSGTVADFQGTTHVISKNQLTTRAAVYEQLNDPSFVHSFDYGDFVYFVFRETALESLNCGKRVYSRIARVCKNDRGDKKTQTKWTSFLKSRLNCSVPGEYPFYFDEVQSVTNAITGTYGGQIRDIIYAVFTTPPNSVSGSAVCAFSIRSIQDTFNGDFKGQETQQSNWLPVPRNKIPKSRRPGSCIPTDEALPDDEFVGFIQSHTLMDAAVPGFFNRPFVSAFGYRFTTIAVDPQVRLQDGRTIDVLFLGAGAALSIVKLINVISYENIDSAEPIIIEEIRIFSRPATITNMYLMREKSGEEEQSKGGRLIITTTDEVKSIDVQRCDRATSCKSCVGLRDPYCGWDVHERKCVKISSSSNTGESMVLQYISGDHYQCSVVDDEDRNTNYENHHDVDHDDGDDQSDDSNGNKFCNDDKHPIGHENPLIYYNDNISTEYLYDDTTDDNISTEYITDDNISTEYITDDNISTEYIYEDTTDDNFSTEYTHDDTTEIVTINLSIVRNDNIPNKIHSVFATDSVCVSKSFVAGVLVITGILILLIGFTFGFLLSRRLYMSTNGAHIS
uniref:Semaphorin-1A-like protein n=1 Tax=Penaeus monodon majanivirus A TaxID=2984271 RepID=A0A9C7BV02_9VIRU|nr:MAG: semaphorin-1A-like protein [Penaeus monodon majanivirus A]